MKPTDTKQDTQVEEGGKFLTAPLSVDLHFSISLVPVRLFSKQLFCRKETSPSRTLFYSYSFARSQCVFK